MYERLLVETERHLRRHQDIAVPVKKLWQTMTETGKRIGFAVPSLGDFSCLLDGDKRFVFVASGEGGAEITEEDLVNYEDLERLGFLGNQSVRVRHDSSDLDEFSDEEEEAVGTATDEGDQLLDRELIASGKARGRRKKPVVAVKKVPGGAAKAGTTAKQRPPKRTAKKKAARRRK